MSTVTSPKNHAIPFADRAAPQRAESPPPKTWSTGSPEEKNLHDIERDLKTPLSPGDAAKSGSAVEKLVEANGEVQKDLGPFEHFNLRNMEKLPEDKKRAFCEYCGPALLNRLMDSGESRSTIKKELLKFSAFAKKHGAVIDFSRDNNHIPATKIIKFLRKNVSNEAALSSVIEILCNLHDIHVPFEQSHKARRGEGSPVRINFLENFPKIVPRHAGNHLRHHAPWF
jgi:hypothetical protein